MMSPTTPTALASGVVRLLPLPRPSRVTSVQGSLALGPVARVDPPAAPRVQARPGCDVISVDPEIRSQLEQWTGRILQAAADIVSGDRPVSQLVRWTTAEVHDDLSRRARLIAAAAGHQAGCGRGSAPLVRPQLVAVTTSFVRSDAVEVSARVRYGARCRALAARFEIRDQRWQCCAIEFA